MKVWPGIVAALIVVAVFCVYLATMTDGMVPSATDWAMYVMHARNILHEASLRRDPVHVVCPETSRRGLTNSYPSGFPPMLAPVYAVFGLNIRAFKIVSDAALALSLLPIYLLSRRYLSPLSAMLIMLATAFGSLYVTSQKYRQLRWPLSISLVCGHGVGAVAVRSGQGQLAVGLWGWPWSWQSVI